jgi:hypothetical protein
LHRHPRRPLGLLVEMVNFAWNRPNLVELIASVCNASDAQRAQIVKQLEALPSFERLLRESEGIESMPRTR